MKTSSRLTVILCLLCVLLGGLLWWRHTRAIAARQAAAQNEIRALREQLATAEGRLREAERNLALRAAPDAAPAGAAVPTRRRPGPTPEVFSLAIDDTARGELQRLQALHERAALDSRFAALFRALKLSPEKLERLKTLLVNRELAAADAMTAAIEHGIDPRTEPGALRQAVNAALSDADRAIAELLGPDAYRDYEGYRETLPQRGLVEQLQQRLSYTSEPLTETQSAELVRILAATTPPPDPAGGVMRMAVMAGPGSSGPINNVPISNEAIAQAQGVLTAGQLQALREMQLAQQAQREAMQRLPRPEGMMVLPPAGRR